MQPGVSETSREKDLSDCYAEVRSYTEKLCKPLEIEDYVPQPEVFASPPKWNIAHTTWFFEEMILKKFVPGYKVFDPNFCFLFNSYYNSIGTRTARDHRGDLSRPTVERVFAYRKYVDERMREILEKKTGDGKQETGDESDGATRGRVDAAINPQSAIRSPQSNSSQSELRDLVILGLNHEQQHQELFLTDLKYSFGINPLFPVYRENFFPEETAEQGISSWIGVEAGSYEIGYEGKGFCFDNELTRHKAWLDGFEIADRLITNREFLDFINDGGYRDHRLWHSDGWDRINQAGINSPLYWHEKDGEWFHFTLGGLRDLPPDAPVCHVSFYEAAAFAEWRGTRLPTEFEWETASGKFDWGSRWEWTNSAYLPYPGFKKAAGAVGEYNGKFMVNQMVLRGASVATPPGHSRSTYRNFFQPELRWQFTGIRLAK